MIFREELHGWRAGKSDDRGSAKQGVKGAVMSSGFGARGTNRGDKTLNASIR